jgi:hypothetical protein
MCKTNLQQTEMWISVTIKGFVPKRLPQIAGDFIAPFIEDAPTCTKLTLSYWLLVQMIEQVIKINFGQ